MAEFAVSQEEKYSKRLSNPDLRCKNKCGFYGNPIYHGYCSKCYKELVRDAPKPPDALQTFPEEQVDSASGGLSFGKFNMKRRVMATAKGRGKLFKSGSPLKASTGAVPFPEAKESRKSKKQPRVVEPFNEFLKTLKKPAAQDIVQHLKTFRKHITEKMSATVDEQGEAVQDFYTSMGERLQTHPLFRSMNEEQQEDMMDGIEKHLTTSIYQKVFSPESCDDEMKDLLLQRRIRMLHWLEPQHLDIALNLHNPEVQDMISTGRQELWSMDTKKAPQDKLSCIAKCCMHLMAALRISQDGPASADEFLPSLIFMIIYTSPQHLHSNINYISRFSSPMRVMSGEAGYYFTNLCGAISFIENLSAENLKMSENDFNTKMGYVDGKTDADLLLEEDDGVEDEERILVLKSCCQGMKELTDRLQLMLVEAEELDVKMKEFREGLREQVDSILGAPPPRILLGKHREQYRIGLDSADTGKSDIVSPQPP